MNEMAVFWSTDEVRVVPCGGGAGSGVGGGGGGASPCLPRLLPRGH